MGEVSTIGLDIAKSVFQIHGVDAYRGVKRDVTSRGPLVIAAQPAGVKKVLANSEPSTHST